jgi:hypothetical protein
MGADRAFPSVAYCTLQANCCGSSASLTGSGVACREGSSHMDIIVAGLRMIERLLAVGIGGMSIYLGYRLFFALPTIRDASGEFHLPFDIKVILWRIGPGAFFALFGAAVVALSFYSSVRYDDVARAPATVNADSASRVDTRSFAGLGSARTTDSGAAQRADARKLLQRDMVELNALSGKLRDDLAEPDRAEVGGLVRRVKLKLLRSVWDSNWGDPSTFDDWLASDRPDPPPALVDAAELYFRGTSKRVRP